MRRRAEQVDQTRLRITEAAMRLHTTVGPARTTISAVAEEAGVTRVTVYRHFPDEEQLFAACSGHWMALHPAPDPGAWLKRPPVEPRARYALAEVYAWYQETHQDLYRFFRDIEAMPAGVQEGLRTAATQMGDALIDGSGVRGKPRRRLRAAAGHAFAFPTWWSLSIEQELAPEDVVDLAVRFVMAAIDA